MCCGRRCLKMAGKNLVVFMYVIIVLKILYVSANNDFAYVVPKNCKDSTYYDITKLDCQKCPGNSTNSKSDGGFSCECKTEFITVKDYGGEDVQCTGCSEDEVPTQDKWHCIRHRQTGSGCPSETITVDRSQSGRLEINQSCVTCEGDTYPDAAGVTCIRCHQSYVNVTGSCTCLPPNQEVNGMCFHANDPILVDHPKLYELSYQNKAVDSRFMRTEYRGATAMCRIFRNITACQVLGNLCALTMYTYASKKLNLPCAEFRSISGEKAASGSMPWLYYYESSGEILNSNTIQTEFSFRSTSENSELRFKIARYTLEGAFLGMQDLTGSMLQLCKGSDKELNAAFVFGTKYHKQCTVSSQYLWDKQRLELWDVFYFHKNVLYPVPLLVVNYTKDGEYVNRDGGKWQLTTRLFLIDNVLARKDGAIDSSMSDYLRYARHLELRIKLKDNTGTGRINQPYFKVVYEDIPKQSYNNDLQVPTSFSVTYSMTRNKYNGDIEAALVILAGAGGVYGIVKTWGWSKRAGRIAIDFLTLVKMVLFACGPVGDMFFLVMFGAAFWDLIVFKNQDKVIFLMPNADEETNFVIYVSCAFALKCLDVLHMLVNQVTIDIFLIDWEKPRGKVSIPRSNNSEEQTKTAPVSIWRTYFVANEWNELQTIRKTNPVFQIISAVFFLKVIGFENLATVDPNSNFQKEEGAYDCPDSRMARLAIAVSVYMVIALVQWVFFMFVYERFIEDKVRQFVDLCSVSNVSVFIMQYEQWGYYIHGRSVNGVADTDMWETYQQLKREEQSLRQSRGLLPNTDQQTFQMAISKKLRAHYDRVFSPLTSNQPTQMTSGPSAGPSRAIDDMRADQGIQAYLTINKFLSGYIDHSLRDIDYVVKDKLLLENVLDVELYDTFDTGVFFTDSGHSFDKVLLYGNELKLLVFDVMLFTIVDLAAHDFLLAGIICYFVTQGIVIFRNSGGKKNLARKTLVDERFLI